MREDWVKCLLDDLLVFMTNGSSAKQFEEEVGLPISRIETIWNEKIDFNRVKYIKECDSDFIDKYRIVKNDILLSHINSDSHLGKTAIFKDDKKTFIHGINLLKLRPVPTVNADLLLYQLRFKRIKGDFIAVAQRAVNQSSINQRKLKTFNFILPPIPEQRAIVAKIETLFSDLDKGIADLKTAQAQLKVYRQAVLKKAFEGELTKEWREQQTNLPTAEELLEQIKVDFDNLVSDKKKKKEKALQEIQKKEIPHLIPNVWSWCNLGDVTWFINGDRGKNYPNRSEYVESGVPWINTGHIEPNGFLSAEKMNYITREKFETLRSGAIQFGDLVYCLRGATFGKTAFVEPYTEGSIASSLMIIRSNDKINKTYLYHFLTCVEGKKQLQRFDNGTAQPNLSANMVRSYAFPLPTTEEQNKIVLEIETRLSICDKIEQSITQSLEKSQALRQSILKKAFEGSLLSETEIAACKAEKDYEPASVLLARIKAEKNKQ